MSLITTIIDGIKPNVVTGLGGANEGHINGLASDSISGIIGGVVDLAAGHGLVAQAGTPNMTVLVADGIVYVPNSSYSEFSATTTKFWRVVISAETAKVITANASGSTRIDLLCVKVDKTATPNEFGSNVSTLIVVAGTPGAGTPATPNDHYILANVTVTNGETAINTGDISDQRDQILINTDLIMPETMYAADAGSTDTYAITLSPVPAAYTTGMVVRFKANTVNTGAATLNVNSLGAKTIVKHLNLTLANSDIKANQLVEVIYDGTNFQLLSPIERITPRILSATSYTTNTGASLNIDNLDQFIVTAQAGALLFNNPTGTPTEGQRLLIAVTGTAARALTYDTQFEASTVALPTTTVTTARLNMEFIWRADTSKWVITSSGAAGAALSSKTKLFTRDIAGANGDVSYTGIGFIPTSIIFSYMTTDGKCVGTGMVDSVKAMVSYFSAQQAGYLSGDSASDKCIYFSNQSGTNQQALLKTYDADGFTLTWNKVGTPTGTGSIIAMCFR